MTKTMRVKPADGRIVRDPLRGDDLQAEGRDVPRTVYWRRCVQSGDVIEITGPDVAQGKASKGSKG
ncbi:DUF2635 domain-containing protein [Burkholderia arboris]|uniref:DUF2635 domain-containing protein n=1 Tax=Burkholderia metallica TaxID=488729 RepID=A0ABT8PG54_9BURK|nr:MULTISPECIES: DUF2635 domain-containing protein [Burkholderia cepacia complex]MCA8037842.1 DUF2635 domain-containing protein [Burkholderia arboris]MDN7933665.1 DUF2635 domain-containing protein [Burkholderia metallica]